MAQVLEYYQGNQRQILVMFSVTFRMEAGG
jgi:hypothetical protein